MNLTGTDKDAIAVFAVKVALALYRAIVLSIGIVQLDADPDTGSERGLADEEYFAVTKLGDLDTRVQVERLRRGAWRPGRCHGCPVPFQMMYLI